MDGLTEDVFCRISRGHGLTSVSVRINKRIIGDTQFSYQVIRRKFDKMKETAMFTVIFICQKDKKQGPTIMVCKLLDGAEN